MARSKKDSDNKIYSFTIDANDPKYVPLVNFLDEIDSGARSFIIRQILNSYIQGQSGNPFFGMLGNVPQSQPVNPNTMQPSIQETVQEEDSKQESKITPPSFDQKTEKKEKEKKPIIQDIPQMRGLADQFS